MLNKTCKNTLDSSYKQWLNHLANKQTKIIKKKQFYINSSKYTNYIKTAF